MPTPRFATLLGEQVCHEFTASQQYVALAVWFDAHDLPQLATHFYRQAVEERNHAMMMVRYMLDRDLPVTVPGVAVKPKRATRHGASANFSRFAATLMLPAKGLVRSPIGA